MSDTTTYYLQKKGVQLQGVYWIGESLEEGKDQANLYAKNDVDDYHAWIVFMYVYGTPPVIMYSIRQKKSKLNE